MTTRIAWLVLLCLTTGAPLRAQSAVRADGDSAAEAEVAALEHHLIDLLARGELEDYAAYLAADYVRVNRDGVVATAAEALAGFGGAGPTVQTPSEIGVRIYGDTAILSFVLTSRAGEAVRRSRLVKVFVRRDGRWIMVHNQGTPLE